MHKKLLLILNPNAGVRMARRFLPEIIDHFRKAGFLSVVCVTAARGDAVTFAAEETDGMDLVVVSGGDGTLNEVITGLLQSGKRLPVGYLPSGSTNDFATGLGFGKDLMENCAIVTGGSPRHLDVGLFDGKRYFSYTASFGAFTSASYSTPQSTKNVLGHTAYILEGIRLLPEIRPIHARIETETGDYEGDYLFGAVCNSTSLAGILKLDPADVNMNDGVFEMLLVRTPKDLMELNRIISCLAAKKHDDPMITFIRASRLTITTDTPIHWTLDGEEAEADRTVCIENLHNAITVLCPAIQPLEME